MVDKKCNNNDNLPEEIMQPLSGRSSSENESEKAYHPGFCVRLGLMEMTL